MEICFDLTPHDTAAKSPSTIQAAPVGTLPSIKERDEVPVIQELFSSEEMQGRIQFDIQKLFLNH